VQIIGRGRGVRRTAANPLIVLVLTNVPLPLPLAGVITWDEIAPSHRDRMLSERGFAPASPADAAACFPHFWPNPNAAKQAFHKKRWVSSPIEKIIYRESNPPLPVATYQKVGAGKKPASVPFDPERLGPDALRAALEDDLGALAWFRVEGEPNQPPSEPPKPPQNRASAGPQGRHDQSEPSPQYAPAAVPDLAMEAAAPAENSGAERDWQGAPPGIWPARVAPAEDHPLWPPIMVEQIEDRRPGSG
jgi:hypothetical protein